MRERPNWQGLALSAQAAWESMGPTEREQLLLTVRLDDPHAPAAWQRESDAIADTVLALADDYLTEHPDGADTDQVYDWLVTQAAAIRKATA